MIKKYGWEPLYCKVTDIIDLIQEYLNADVLLVSLIFEYDGCLHKIGMLSDFDTTTSKFIPKFFLDNQSFSTFEDFKEKAKIENNLFLNINEPIRILCDEVFGNPRRYKLLQEREL